MMSNNGNILLLAKKIIKFEEGFRAKPYYCTEGYPTIGWGQVVGEKNAPLPNIIWNEGQALNALEARLEEAIKELSSTKATKEAYNKLNDDRKAILISMWYQLGITKLSGFKDTLKALEASKFDDAAKEMLDSKAAKKTPKRWQRQSKAMLAGDISTIYKV
jgi:lysozyme